MTFTTRSGIAWDGCSLAGAALLLASCAGVVSSPDESDGLGAAGRSSVQQSSTSSGTGQTTTTSGGSGGANTNVGGGPGGAGTSTGGQAVQGGAGNGSGTGGSSNGGSTGSGGATGMGGSPGTGGAGGSAGGSTGTQPFKGVAFEVNANCADLDRLKVSWYYNWSSSTRCNVQAEYVPQLARNWGTNANAVTPAKVAAGGYKTILGFNEPDQAAQANMSVADVLKLWPQFNQPAFSRVGSPATSSSDQGKAWFQQFMTGVQQQGLRVDFIALHWYGWNAGSCTPTANLLEDYIKWAEQWKKPLWITEWSCHLQSADVTRAFFAGALAMFKRHPLVERYAWFLSRSTGEFAGAALLDANGNPTALGQDYIAAPAYH
jgi:hypothetical protein